jgi:hypothetical protein
LVHVAFVRLSAQGLIRRLDLPARRQTARTGGVELTGKEASDATGDPPPGDDVARSKSGLRDRQTMREPRIRARKMLRRRTGRHTPAALPKPGPDPPGRIRASAQSTCRRRSPASGVRCSSSLGYAPATSSASRRKPARAPAAQRHCSQPATPERTHPDCRRSRTRASKWGQVRRAGGAAG